MIFEKIPANLKLMSIGTNCLFSNIVLCKSPLDRIYIKNTNSLKLLSLIDEYTKFLNENNLNRKTFVFCEEKYSKNFDNVILINSIDYAESDNYDKWLQQFRKNSNDVSLLFKQQGYDLKSPIV